MSRQSFRRLSPQNIGIACAAGATTLGIVYLALAEAPAQLFSVNIAALILGLVMLLAFKQVAAALCSVTGYAMLISASALLATSLIGESAEGASRWIKVGPLFIQPSLIVLPLMVVGFLQNRTSITAFAMLIAALGMAIQPDRAMAGVLVAGLAVQAFLRLDRYVIIALIGGLIALGITFVRPDALPAMPYVDQIYYTSFDVSLLAGVAVLGGTFLLLAPALTSIRFAPENRDACLVFGSVWLALIIAAALGNYPTPVVGYSGAAVLGYVMSLIALPSQTAPSRLQSRFKQGQDERQKQAAKDDLNFAPAHA